MDPTYFLIGGTVLSLAEAVLIVILMIQRKRRQAAETILRERLAFEELLGSLSAQFVSMSSDQVDREIDGALKSICDHLGFDLAGLWQRKDEDANWLTITHLYRPAGGAPLPDRIDAREMFPWCLRQFTSGTTVISVPSVRDLPPEAALDQQMWQLYGIKSALNFALSAGKGPLTGALSFSTMREERLWPEALVRQLQLIVQVFANAIARKHTENALIESEERLDLAASSADVGLWTLNTGTGKIWASDKARELYGFGPEEELWVAKILDLCHRDDRERVRANMERSLDSGEYSGNEYRIVRPDGHIRWILARGRSYSGPSGAVERFMGLVMDITERREIENMVRSAAQEWQATFDSISDLVMILDTDGRILRINAAAKTFFDLSEDAITWTGWHRLISGKGEPFETSSLAGRGESREYEEAEIYNEKKNIWFSVSTDPVIGSGGTIEYVILKARNITEQKRVEAEAFASRKKLLRTDRLLRMGELTASLAHELNQPLTSILSNARAALRFIQAGTLDMKELEEILQDIAHDDTRAGNIIRSLRSMVRQEESVRDNLDINNVVRDAIALSRSDALIRNVRVSMSLTETLPSVHIDRVQIEQVLINLIMNAAEAMTSTPIEKKEIFITTGARGNGNILVTVRDWGIGIGTEDPQKLFEPFFSTKRTGLGMGLSLGRSVIETHGGRIWAANNRDEGATFSFELPSVR